MFSVRFRRALGFGEAPGYLLEMHAPRPALRAASAVLLAAAILALTVGAAPRPPAPRSGPGADRLIDPVRQALHAGVPLSYLPVIAKGDGGGAAGGALTGSVLSAAPTRPGPAFAGAPRALSADRARAARPGRLHKLLCTYRL